MMLRKFWDWLTGPYRRWVFKRAIERTRDRIHQPFYEALMRTPVLEPEDILKPMFPRLDEDIDTSDVPELGPEFFEEAVLTRPGEPLIDRLRKGNACPRCGGDTEQKRSGSWCEHCSYLFGTTFLTNKDIDE